MGSHSLITWEAGGISFTHHLGGRVRVCGEWDLREGRVIRSTMHRSKVGLAVQRGGSF